MKKRTIFLPLLIILFLLGSVAFTGAGTALPGQVDGDQAVIRPFDGNPPPEARVQLAGIGNTDMTAHGTMWVPELRGAYSMFKPLGWGTAVRVKAVGLQWVHIAPAYPTYIDGIAQRIQYVEFCAQSGKGTVNKPVRMDLWAYDGKFLTVAIAWPADNAKHCFGYTFGAPLWKQDIGISVQLNFGNTTDVITLYKAWIRLVP